VMIHDLLMCQEVITKWSMIQEQRSNFFA